MWRKGDEWEKAPEGAENATGEYLEIRACPPNYRITYVREQHKHELRVNSCRDWGVIIAQSLLPLEVKEIALNFFCNLSNENP